MTKLPKELKKIHFILTNKCNIRCVYCPQGSHPDSYHAEMSDEFFDELLNFIKTHEIKHVGLGYYGELTMVKDWWKQINKLLDAGVRCSTTTNGSTLLSADEVATLARFDYIEWSIDTHEVELLKKVRKKVDARTIVHNFHLVKSHCMRWDLPCPELAWTGVLSIDVAHTLADFVNYAASCGVKVLNFNEIGVYENAPIKGLNISVQEEAVFLEAASQVELAMAYASRYSMRMNMAEWPRIKARRDAIYAGEDRKPTLVKTSTPVADIYTQGSENRLPQGYTRDCPSPWSEFYLDPKGQVFACCTRGDVMGIGKTKQDLEKVFTGEKYQKLRKSLETGVGLDDACATCLLRPAVPVQNNIGDKQKLVA